MAKKTDRLVRALIKTEGKGEKFVMKIKKAGVQGGKPSNRIKGAVPRKRGSTTWI